MIRIGIIGTGLIAKEHAQAISMLPGSTKLVAASDVSSERLGSFCTYFQVPNRYEDAADLIADRDIDLVAITTPPVAHEALAVAALEAGKYVFCEKPLADSLASGVRIAEAEARHPGRFAVSHQLRYDPSFRRLIWLCRNGWIGQIQSARVERHSYIPHTNYGSGWWGSWKVAGGGVLMTQLIHEVDLLLLAIGHPLSVSAVMDTRYTGIESEDYVDAIIRFSGDATARCVASVNSGRLRSGFTVQGTSGRVGLPWNFTTDDRNRMSRAVKELDRALPDTRAQSFISRGSRFLGRKMGLKVKPAWTPHARLYQEIANSIARGSPLPIPPAEALRSLEVCAAAYESAIKGGKEIRVPLDSTSTVYGGLSKQDYDARKRSQEKNERRGIRKMSSNVVRVGLIGLDTSHAPTLTSILHNPNDPFHIPGAKVVAAYAGGSPDMPISISRVAGFASQLRDTYGVRIVDAPEDVAEACDLVFILASDGRVHPALLSAVARYGRPVFIDKPFAVSVSDAKDMLTLAAETGTRLFASSAFRYADALVSALNSIRAAGERVKTCRVFYWLQIQETQGRYFWYGIHASEMLLAVMGKGVREVEVSSKGDQDTINVSHEDGRRSSLVGAKNDGTFHVSIETDKRTVEIDLGPSISSVMARMLAAALDVLTEEQFPRLWRATATGSVFGSRVGRAFDPDAEETMEVIRLLEAAQLSYASKQKTAV